MIKIILFTICFLLLRSIRLYGSTELYTSFEGRRAMVPGAKNPQEINVGFFHVLNPDYAIRGSVFKGLNNGGPDFGMNFGVVRWF